MPTDIEKLTGLEHGEFMDVMSKYLYESIGAAEFGRRHPLIEKACVVVPSTAHISYKGSNCIRNGKKQPCSRGC